MNRRTARTLMMITILLIAVYLQANNIPGNDNAVGNALIIDFLIWAVGEQGER